MENSPTISGIWIQILQLLDFINFLYPSCADPGGAKDNQHLKESFSSLTPKIKDQYGFIMLYGWMIFCPIFIQIFVVLFSCCRGSANSCALSLGRPAVARAVAWAPGFALGLLVQARGMSCRSTGRAGQRLVAKLIKVIAVVWLTIRLDFRSGSLIKNKIPYLGEKLLDGLKPPCSLLDVAGADKPNEGKILCSTVFPLIILGCRDCTVNLNSADTAKNRDKVSKCHSDTVHYE